MQSRWIVQLAIAAVLVPACASGGSDATRPAGARTTTTTTTTSSPTSSSTAPPVTVPFGGTTEPTSSASTVDRTAFLRSIRVAHRDGVDRVTFEFDGTGRPGVSIGYVDRPVADGSGDDVAVKGGASLEVRLEPSSMYDLRGETPKPIYEGPDRVTGDSRVVTEVVKGGDFEGAVTWFIGVRRRTPFRLALLLSAPSQVTIELAAS